MPRPIPPWHWSTPSTTPEPDRDARTLRVTHPFHPWFNREFAFIGIRQGLGENRVFFLDAEGVQHCLPVPWTDAAEPDVFVVMAAGRCAFRVDDLIALAGLIEGLRGAHPGAV